MSLNPEEIDLIEDRYEQDGEPTLGDALRLCVRDWRSERTRAVALRLMFLTWYSCSEPTELTGLSESQHNLPLFQEAFEWLGGDESCDPEFLYIVERMATHAPWCCGDEKEWSARAMSFRQRLESVDTDLLTATFSERGAYGAYFRHMLAHRQQT